MSESNVNIRKEKPEDHEAVRNVHLDAFGEKHGEDVATLVERIRDSGDRYIDDFSLLAEKDGEVVGHVLLSYVDIVDSDSGVKRILSLSPLGVAKNHAGEGIGSNLVNAALEVADERHEPVVVLEGLPEYYPRFGFEPAHEAGIHYPSHVPVAAAMLKKLTKYNPSIKGKIEYPEAFNHLEHHRPSNEPFRVPLSATKRFEREGFSGNVYIPNDANLGFAALQVDVHGRHPRKRMLDGTTRSYYVADGEGTFTLGDITYTVSKGDLFVIPPNGEYEYEGNMTLLEFNISPDNSFQDEKLE